MFPADGTGSAGLFGIVHAIEESSREGSGVAMYNGSMIGPPMERRARKVLALLEAAQKGRVNIE